MNKKRDYCTCFPDYWEHIDIHTACKAHDNRVGMRGTYNPFIPHIMFYKDLRELGVTKRWSVIIALGGAVFTWVRQPYFWYKIYKFRKTKEA